MAVLSAKGSTAQFRVQLLPLSFSALVPLIFGLFAIGGTHDYLAWNQARWQALNDLMAKDGVSYKNIDGGFEFNGLYAYQSGYRIDPSKSPWWVDRDDYLISFGPVPGYMEMRRYPFERWLPPEEDHIFVLRRMDELENGQAVIR
jgi:hypothetical protein